MLISWWHLKCRGLDDLVTTWWPLGDNLVTSVVTTFWPLGYRLGTSWVPLRDYLMTTCVVYLCPVGSMWSFIIIGVEWDLTLHKTFKSGSRQGKAIILSWSDQNTEKITWNMKLDIYWNVFLPFNPMIVWEQISIYHPPGCEKFSVRSQRCDQSDVPQNFSGTEPSYHHTIIIITIIVVIINIINIIIVIIFIIIKIKQMICRTSLAPTTQSQHHPLSLSSQLRFTSLGWLIIS